jgi:mRNA interferase RelE/StbE
MNIVFDKAFEKAIKKYKDKTLNSKIIKIIEEVEKANSINGISRIKKLVGFESYYRIRVGDYRIGIELLQDNTLVFITFAHRKEIYQIFP